MRNTFRIAAAAVMLLGAAGTARAGAGAEVRHSGTIVTVDPGKNRLTLEEMGPWTPEHAVKRTRAIGLDASTKIELVARTRAATTAGGWPGGYEESALTVGDLKPGDFVTVTATKADHGLRAVSITVVRPANG
jgi:hypothetical protein